MLDNDKNNGKRSKGIKAFNVLQFVNFLLVHYPLILLNLLKIDNNLNHFQNDCAMS